MSGAEGRVPRPGLWTMGPNRVEIESWWPGLKLNLIGFKLTWQSDTYEILRAIGELSWYVVKGKHQEPDAFRQVFCLWFNGEMMTMGTLSIQEWASNVMSQFIENVYWLIIDAQHVCNGFLH